MVDDELLREIFDLEPESEPPATAPEPASAGEDGIGPLRLGLWAVAAIAVVALAVGFGLGSLRSATELDRGASPTTSVVTRPAGGAPTTPTAPTTAPPAAAPPTVAPTTSTLAFDGSIPAAVDGATVTASTGWTVADGSVAAPDDRPLPIGAALPRPPGQDPSLTVAPSAPVATATVRLVEPTGFSGLGLGTGADGSWQLVASPELDQLRLFQDTAGLQEQRALLDLPITEGMAIGVYVVDDRIGVLIDGKPVELRTFFGPQFTVEAPGIDRSTVTLVVGDGGPRFDDLAFG